MKLKIVIPLILLIFSFSYLPYSLANYFPDSGQDLIPLYDSLLRPPADCRDAYSNAEYDSVKNEFVISDKLRDQYELINKLYDEYKSESEKTEKNKFAAPPLGPDGSQLPKSGPPQGSNGPPGGFRDVPDGIQEIMEDMNNANLIMDKITVNTEKYKSELKRRVEDLNAEIKSTLQNDYEGRVRITDKFLSKEQSEYNKYYVLFRNNILKINDILKKYDYGVNVKFLPLKNELLGYQTSVFTNLKFLITITKEFSITGAKFYYDDKIRQ